MIVLQNIFKRLNTALRKGNHFVFGQSKSNNELVSGNKYHKHQQVADSIERKFDHLQKRISNTPLFEIVYEYKGAKKRFYAKCEQLSISGSLHDRLALHVLRRAYESKKIKASTTIIVAAEKDKALSYAVIGRMLGNPVTVLVPDFWIDTYYARQIDACGAALYTIGNCEKGIYSLMDYAYDLASKTKHSFLINELDLLSEYNIQEKTTAREIWMQFQNRDITPAALIMQTRCNPDSFFALSNYLSGRNDFFKSYAAGIKEFEGLFKKQEGTLYVCKPEPSFLPVSNYPGLKEEVTIAVSSKVATQVAQLLTKQLGIAAGLLSGINILAAIRLQEQKGFEKPLLTMFQDSQIVQPVKLNDLWLKDEFMQHDIENDLRFLDYIPL